MKEVLMAQMASQLAPVFAALISALVSWGLFEVAKFVRNKTNNEAANGAVTHITETVNTTVKELEQTMVPSFIELTKDGKLTQDDKYKLKELAIRKVNEQLPEKMTKAAQVVVNSIDQFIKAKIEQAVLELKK